MRICIISPTVIAINGNNQKYGGIETVIALISDELVKLGHEVYLFAAGTSHSKAKLIFLTQKPLGHQKNTNQEKKVNQVAYKKSIDLCPDVIWDNTLAMHAHSIGDNLSKYIYKAAISLDSSKLVNTNGIPVVHTLHGPAKDHMPALAHELSAMGHYFVSISKDQARRYSKYIARRQHLDTIYNPVDIDFYKANYNKRTDNYYIWVGRYGMEKSPHIALAVAHRLNIPVKMVGKKTEKHEKIYFNKFIKPFLKPGDEVISSNISATEKAKLFRGAKATLMTNLWAEPFGIVIAESMASGTMVVGPALGSLTELVNSAGVLVPVNDLRLDENEIEVTIKQKRYIDRVVKYVKNNKQIPGKVIRKRAEYLFAPRLIAAGYEEAFQKAVYLKK
jgi:glycosyltransferase involved in cell wall biosynthesis